MEIDSISHDLLTRICENLCTNVDLDTRVEAMLEMDRDLYRPCIRTKGSIQIESEICISKQK